MAIYIGDGIEILGGEGFEMLEEIIVNLNDVLERKSKKRLKKYMSEYKVIRVKGEEIEIRFFNKVAYIGSMRGKISEERKYRINGIEVKEQKYRVNKVYM